MIKIGACGNSELASAVILDSYTTAIEPNLSYRSNVYIVTSNGATCNNCILICVQCNAIAYKVTLGSNRIALDGQSSIVSIIMRSNATAVHIYILPKMLLASIDSHIVAGNIGIIIYINFSFLVSDSDISRSSQRITKGNLINLVRAICIVNNGQSAIYLTIRSSQHSQGIGILLVATANSDIATGISQCYLLQLISSAIQRNYSLSGCRHVSHSYYKAILSFRNCTIGGYQICFISKQRALGQGNAFARSNISIGSSYYRAGITSHNNILAN